MIQIQSALTLSQQQQIFRIWNKVYPAHLVQPDMQTWEAYLLQLKHATHYVWENDTEVRGWMVTFDRRKMRWFILIVSEDAQRTGIGRGLIQFAQQRETELWGLVVDHNRYLRTDGKIYPSPLSFYQKLGFLYDPDDRYENERISAIKIWWKKPVSSDF